MMTPPSATESLEGGCGGAAGARAEQDCDGGKGDGPTRPIRPRTNRAFPIFFVSFEFS
jgi:hypothetical protein